MAGTKLTRKIDNIIKKSVEQNLSWAIWSKMSDTNTVVNTVGSDVDHYVSFTEVNYLVSFFESSVIEKIPAQPIRKTEIS